MERFGTPVFGGEGGGDPLRVMDRASRDLFPHCPLHDLFLFPPISPFFPSISTTNHRSSRRPSHLGRATRFPPPRSTPPSAAFVPSFPPSRFSNERVPTRTGFVWDPSTDALVRNTRAHVLSSPFQDHKRTCNVGERADVRSESRALRRKSVQVRRWRSARLGTTGSGRKGAKHDPRTARTSTWLDVQKHVDDTRCERRWSKGRGEGLRAIRPAGIRSRSAPTTRCTVRAPPSERRKKRSRLGSPRLVLHLPSTIHVSTCIVETRPSACCGELWTSDVANDAVLGEGWPLQGQWRTMEREWDGEHRWIAVLERSARYSY